MIDLPTDEFDALVDEVFDALPESIVGNLDNVAIVTEDLPEDGDLDLLGLYDGVSLTERGEYGYGELPDRIVLFRIPLLRAGGDLAGLRREVRITLVHEIAHYYGIDDARLHELGWA